MRATELLASRNSSAKNDAQLPRSEFELLGVEIVLLRCSLLPALPPGGSVGGGSHGLLERLGCLQTPEHWKGALVVVGEHPEDVDCQSWKRRPAFAQEPEKRGQSTWGAQEVGLCMGGTAGSHCE